MKKSILGTKNEMVDGKINHGRETLILEHVYGLCRRKNDLYKPPNRGSLYQTNEQYKNKFLAMER